MSELEKSFKQLNLRIKQADLIASQHLAEGLSPDVSHEIASRAQLKAQLTGDTSKLPGEELLKHLVGASQAEFVNLS